MSRTYRLLAVTMLVFALSGLILVGCNQSPTTANLPANPTIDSDPKISKAVQNKPLESEHPHIPGAHGGIVIPIGSDSYHAEAVIEKDGKFRLLMLGADETRIQEVDVQPVKAYVKSVGETDATPIEMKAVPQEGDADGKTSQFVGLLPESAIGKAIDVTIPNLRIGAERFRVGFTTAVQQHDSGMPAAVSGAEEQKLYFTPVGKYTQADIDANGKLPAGAKFRGLMTKHDMAPMPGDSICPVTLTKANPKVEWQIDGKKYLFCCPPCVDEFVRMAKEEPESLKAPGDYVQAAKQTVGGEKTEPTSANTTSPNRKLDPKIAEALASLNKEDRDSVDSQKYCAIMTDKLLGSMGTPLKVEVNGEPVFLCCKGCKAKALRDADATLATVAKLRGEHGEKR
jgi:YHS domain-containing protein